MYTLESQCEECGHQANISGYVESHMSRVHDGGGENRNLVKRKLVRPGFLWDMDGFRRSEW